MDKKPHLFSLMAETASENKDLDKNFDELEHFDQISEVQRNIEKLHNCNKTIPLIIKHQVDEMLSDVSNDKFREYLSKPPISNPETFPMCNSTKITKDTEFFLRGIKELKEKENSSNLRSELPMIKKSIEMQLDDIKIGQNNLERLFSQLNDLKVKMNKLIVDPKLNENIIRDLIFEENVKKLCDKINDINKYMETKKKIIQLCREQKLSSQNLSDRHAENELPSVISMLLKDIEIALQ